jgi:hypothetical protein
MASSASWWSCCTSATTVDADAFERASEQVPARVVVEDDDSAEPLLAALESAALACVEDSAAGLALTDSNPSVVSLFEGLEKALLHGVRPVPARPSPPQAAAAASAWAAVSSVRWAALRTSKEDANPLLSVAYARQLCGDDGPEALLSVFLQLLLLHSCAHTLLRVLGNSADHATAEVLAAHYEPRAFLRSPTCVSRAVASLATVARLDFDVGRDEDGKALPLPFAAAADGDEPGSPTTVGSWPRNHTLTLLGLSLGGLSGGLTTTSFASASAAAAQPQQRSRRRSVDVDPAYFATLGAGGTAPAEHARGPRSIMSASVSSVGRVLGSLFGGGASSSSSSSSSRFAIIGRPLSEVARDSSVSAHAALDRRVAFPDFLFACEHVLYRMGLTATAGHVSLAAAIASGGADARDGWLADFESAFTFGAVAAEAAAGPATASASPWSGAGAAETRSVGRLVGVAADIPSPDAVLSLVRAYESGGIPALAAAVDGAGAGLRIEDARAASAAILYTLLRLPNPPIPSDRHHTALACAYLPHWDDLGFTTAPETGRSRASSILGEGGGPPAAAAEVGRSRSASGVGSDAAQQQHVSAAAPPSASPLASSRASSGSAQPSADIGSSGLLDDGATPLLVNLRALVADLPSSHRTLLAGILPFYAWLAGLEEPRRAAAAAATTTTSEPPPAAAGNGLPLSHDGDLVEPDPAGPPGALRITVRPPTARRRERARRVASVVALGLLRPCGDSLRAPAPPAGHPPSPIVGDVRVPDHLLGPADTRHAVMLAEAMLLHWRYILQDAAADLWSFEGMLSSRAALLSGVREASAHDVALDTYDEQRVVLKKLWVDVIPAVRASTTVDIDAGTFAIPSPVWKIVGFRRADPLPEFQATAGELGLLAVGHVFGAFRNRALSVLARVHGSADAEAAWRALSPVEGEGEGQLARGTDAFYPVAATVLLAAARIAERLGLLGIVRSAGGGGGGSAAPSSSSSSSSGFGIASTFPTLWHLCALDVGKHGVSTVVLDLVALAFFIADARWAASEPGDGGPHPPRPADPTVAPLPLAVSELPRVVQTAADEALALLPWLALRAQVRGTPGEGAGADGGEGGTAGEGVVRRGASRGGATAAALLDVMGALGRWRLETGVGSRRNAIAGGDGDHAGEWPGGGHGAHGASSLPSEWLASSSSSTHHTHTHIKRFESDGALVANGGGAAGASAGGVMRGMAAPSVYLAEPSAILTEAQTRMLQVALPSALQGGSHRWELLFTLRRDGANVDTLLRRAAGNPATLLVVRDSRGGVFGMFAAAQWAKNAHFFGTAEGWVFTFEERHAEDALRHRILARNEHEVKTRRLDLLGGAGSPTATLEAAALAAALPPPSAAVLPPAAAATAPLSPVPAAAAADQPARAGEGADEASSSPSSIVAPAAVPSSSSSSSPAAPASSAATPTRHYFHVYRWAKVNKHFQSVSTDARGVITGLGVGAVPSAALHLDDSLDKGTTGPCATFLSPPLARYPDGFPRPAVAAAAVTDNELLTPSMLGEDLRFNAVDVELWGFSRRIAHLG